MSSSEPYAPEGVSSRAWATKEHAARNNVESCYMLCRQGALHLLSVHRRTAISGHLPVRPYSEACSLQAPHGLRPNHLWLRQENIAAAGAPTALRLGYGLNSLCCRPYSMAQPLGHPALRAEFIRLRCYSLGGPIDPCRSWPAHTVTLDPVLSPIIFWYEGGRKLKR